MTRQSSMQSTDPQIHTNWCRCRNCQPVRLKADPRGFAKSAQGREAKGWGPAPQGFGRFLPDGHAPLLMLAIGIPALITHLILFS